jgi:hypothetical protein
VRRRKCATLAGLGRNVCLLGLLGVACVVAAPASAAPAPTLFRLTIVGTDHQEWTFTAAPVASGDCRQTETSEGIRSVSFRTTVPVAVRLAGGRVLPVEVRRIAGTVTLAGANTTEEICAGVGTSKIADCAQTRRAFRAASVHVVSPRRGFITLNRIANVRLATADCPREPPDVVRRPLGPALSLLRLPKAALMEGRLARINLHASRTQRKIYGSPEKGSLTESAGWTLTFVRAKG